LLPIDDDDDAAPVVPLVPVLPLDGVPIVAFARTNCGMLLEPDAVVPDPVVLLEEADADVLSRQPVTVMVCPLVLVGVLLVCAARPMVQVAAIARPVAHPVRFIVPSCSPSERAIATPIPRNGSAL